MGMATNCDAGRLQGYPYVAHAHVRLGGRYQQLPLFRIKDHTCLVAAQPALQQPAVQNCTRITLHACARMQPRARTHTPTKHSPADGVVDQGRKCVATVLLRPQIPIYVG